MKNNDIKMDVSVPWLVTCRRMDIFGSSFSETIYVSDIANMLTSMVIQL